MPTTKPSPVTPLIPDGEHVLTLAEVVVKEVDNLKFIRGDRTAPPKVNKWLWRFLSDDMDIDSDPPQHYELAVWTFENYGHAKANLTKLLDMIVPRATPEQKAALNTDVLIGRRFKAQIVHELNEKKEMQARAAFIVPLKQGDAGFAPPKAIERPAEKQTIGAEDVARFDPDTMEPTPETPI